MAGLVAAIHLLLVSTPEDVDARDDPGHDEVFLHPAVPTCGNAIVSMLERSSLPDA
jgi:hypothetical protein